jgi:hypothetical protein
MGGLLERPEALFVFVDGVGDLRLPPLDVGRRG